MQTDLFSTPFFDDAADEISTLKGYKNPEDEEVQSVYRTIIEQWSPSKNKLEPLIIEHPLPSCGDDSRFLPWVLARSNIFTSLDDKDFGKLAKESKDKSITYLDPQTIASGSNKKGGIALTRPWRFESEVALWGNGSIHATGPVLGQTELKVLLQLLWLGRANGNPKDSDFRSHPEEGYIRFDLNQLCTMLGKKKTFRDRERIKEALYCMTKVSLNIVYNGNRFNGALISEFLQSKDLERCIVRVPKSINTLFMPTKLSSSSYSKVPSHYLSTVRSARVSWLINFLISHNLEKVNVFRQDQLFDVMGIATNALSSDALRSLRVRLKKDFSDLVKIGVISGFKEDTVGRRYHVFTKKNSVASD